MKVQLFLTCRMIFAEAAPLYGRLTVLCLALLFCGTLIGIAVPAGLGWDFANFYDTGRRVAAGQITDIYNPESLIKGEQPQGKLSFWGAPVSAYLYAPLSIFKPETALVLFKIQNTLAYFLGLAILYGCLRKHVDTDSDGQAKFAALFAFLCLIYQPFWTVYRIGGQTTPTVFLLCCLALRTHTNSQHLPTSLLLVAAVLIKPAFLIALVLLMLVSGLPFLKNAAIVLVLAALGSIAFLGWSIHETFLRVLVRGLQDSHPWFYNSSLYVLLDNIKLTVNGNPQLFHLLQTILKMIVFGTFFYLRVKNRSMSVSTATKREFDLLMALSFCLLLSQTVWEHYLALLFPLLAFAVASRHDLNRPSRMLLATIFAMSVGQNLIFINFLRDHLSFDSPPALIGVGLFKSGPLLLTLVFLYTERFVTPARLSKNGRRRHVCGL